ncbi:unnamed protein product [Phytomonas sp. EM1]|nr:unnamed protein product [Phytomonas sp. EM1]|eukprot:CCW61387.1 unnamed protein product [Phytomonas sp. isolate EM1]
MPPKVPNLRFKPKLVAKSKPSDPQNSNREELTLLQLERLQQNQQPSPQQSSETPYADSAPGASPRDPGGLSSKNPPSSSSNARPGEEPISTRGGRMIPTRAAPLGHASAACYPDRAEMLPVDTVNAILTPDGDGLDRVICPIPLQPPETVSSSSFSGKASGPSSTVKQEDEEETERGGPRPTEPTLLDGTAFLREGAEELARAHRANWRFYQESLSPKASLDVKLEEEEEYGVGGGDAAGKGEGPLVYLQLPRFFENPPFVFANLPPGRVGELKVFKSGRMVMDIAGVHYDVWAEGGEEGAYATVAVTQPPSDPMDPNAKPSCFEVGTLKMKMICTPAVEED